MGVGLRRSEEEEGSETEGMGEWDVDDELQGVSGHGRSVGMDMWKSGL